MITVYYTEDISVAVKCDDRELGEYVGRLISQYLHEYGEVVVRDSLTSLCLILQYFCTLHGHPVEAVAVIEDELRLIEIKRSEIRTVTGRIQ